MLFLEPKPSFPQRDLDLEGINLVRISNYTLPASTGCWVSKVKFAHRKEERGEKSMTF